jgi:hypothetical protein
VSWFSFLLPFYMPSFFLLYYLNLMTCFNSHFIKFLTINILIRLTLHLRLYKSIYPSSLNFERY